MSSYRKRGNSDWTLSTSTLGWTLAGLALFIVVVFVLGIYVGYDQGIEAGADQAQNEQFSPDEESLLAYVRTTDLSADLEQELIDTLLRQSDEVSSSDGEDAPEEDLGFDRALTEDDLRTSREGETTAEPVEPGRQDQQSGADEPGEDPVSDLLENGSPNSTGGTEPSASLAEQFDREEPFYTIQVMSGPREEQVSRFAEALRDIGHRVVVTEVQQEDNRFFRVRVGTFAEREEAENYAEEMVNAGEIERYWIPSRIVP